MGRKYDRKPETLSEALQMDFTKRPHCSTRRFSRMRDALVKVDRPIYYAMGYWNEDTACGVSSQLSAVSERAAEI